MDSFTIFGMLAVALGIAALPLGISGLDVTIDRLRKSRLGLQFLGQIDAAERVEDERRANAQRLAAIRQQREKRDPEIAKQQADAGAKRRALWEKYLREDAEKDAIARTAFCEMLGLIATESAIEGNLRSTASKLIDGAIATLREEWELTRGMIRSSQERREGVERNGRIEISKHWFTNRQAVLIRIQAIRDAMELCDALKLEPLDEPGVTQRLREIHDTVPPASTMANLVETAA